MNLTRVECRGFRCLEDLVFEPGPGFNIIRGLNAQGKTSLLEAVFYAATSKSHRTSAENELARHGSQDFHVKLDARRIDREVQIEAHWWKGVKRFKVNGVSQSRLSDILGRVQVVFFSPEDVELVKGGAAGRRRFLDMEISQVEPAYLAALQQYRQALRQRNELLKNPRAEDALIDLWDAQLVERGQTIIPARARYVEELDRYAREAHALIAGGEALRLEYEPNVADPGAFAELLLRSRANDRKRGQTHRGPHRDDFAFHVAGNDARAYASQGQQKTASLAMKLAEMRLIHARVGDHAILMLDEVLAELDIQRARQLFGAISGEAQVLVTTTELETREGIFEGARSFRMQGGHLEEEA